jgi:hypothetical protein
MVVMICKDYFLVIAKFFSMSTNSGADVSYTVKKVIYVKISLCSVTSSEKKTLANAEGKEKI